MRFFAANFSLIFWALFLVESVHADLLIANRGSDAAVPNFYAWMEQNAYICENSEEFFEFLSETEAEQFDCGTLCGEPAESGMACARQGRRAVECRRVPLLCMQNFMQEFMALRFGRDGNFQERNLFTSTSTHSTTTPRKTKPKRKKTLLRRAKSSDKSRMLVDSDFVVVQGEVPKRAPTMATVVPWWHTSHHSTTTRFTTHPPATSPPTLATPPATSPTLATPLLAAKLSSREDAFCPPDTDPVACPWWASTGECWRNVRYMHRECRRACGLCRRESDEFRRQRQH